jgi:NitT/TauT family transport system substrate-binding protein
MCFWLQGGLTQEDVDPQYIADNPARVEGLRNGAIDVVSLGEPWITRAVNSGAGEVWVALPEVTPQLPVGLIVYGPSILDENREAGIRFMAAYLRGVEQFNRGKTDRNVELIAEFTQLAPEDIQGSCWNTFRADGGIDTESVMAFQDWAYRKVWSMGA